MVADVYLSDGKQVVERGVIQTQRQVGLLELLTTTRAHTHTQNRHGIPLIHRVRVGGGDAPICDITNGSVFEWISVANQHTPGGETEGPSES